MTKNFSSRMTRIGELLVHNAQETIKQAALAGTEEAVMNTPVKTGNARTNWRISFGRPSTTLIDAPGTPDVGVNRETASARALIEASNKIAKWKIGSGNIYIGNPVDYILELDRGSSRQAMEGMSVFAIEAARDVLRKGRLLRGH